MTYVAVPISIEGEKFHCHCTQNQVVFVNFIEGAKLPNRQNRKTNWEYNGWTHPGGKEIYTIKNWDILNGNSFYSK